MFQIILELFGGYGCIQSVILNLHKYRYFEPIEYL